MPEVHVAAPKVVSVAERRSSWPSPMMRLTRTTFFSVALMLGVRAAWAWPDSATRRPRCQSR
ncbi:MAG: hypothetical protein ABSB76_38230 [Streptosporangiaceae bacterium]